jgi:hypothetical protein
MHAISRVRKVEKAIGGARKVFEVIRSLRVINCIIMANWEIFKKKN